MSGALLAPAQRRDPQKRPVRFVDQQVALQLELVEQPIDDLLVERLGGFQGDFGLDVNFTLGQGIVIEQDGHLHTFTNRVAGLIQRCVFDFDGQELIAEFEGQPEGNEISGEVDYDLGGDAGTIDFTGKRSAGLSDLAGKWELLIETPDGDVFTPTLELTKQGDKV